MKVICPYCDRPAELVTGAAIYPHRPDLFEKRFWLCRSDNAWVGCHPANRGNDGSKPLGRLANAELRKAKQAAHAAFDPLWRNGMMKRGSAYAWLADALGVSKDNCHIGMFDVDECMAVIAAVKERTTKIQEAA